MKSFTAATVALAFVAGAMALTGLEAEAFGGQKGKGAMERGEGVGMQMRATHRDLGDGTCGTEQQRERQQNREERRAEMQKFVGLSHEEMQERRQAGDMMSEVLAEQNITEDDARAFVTERAEERIERVLENRDLGDDEEQTLRERVMAHVERVLDRWF